MKTAENKQHHHAGNDFPGSGNLLPHAGNLFPCAGNLPPHGGNLFPDSGNLLRVQGNFPSMWENFFRVQEIFPRAWEFISRAREIFSRRRVLYVIKHIIIYACSASRNDFFNNNNIGEKTYGTTKLTRHF
ncbi:MAG: hypothetical protein HY960_03890 [Ignavibacteriae bacterium]|nr:hypothetical protein [Ignavibacteriota bacterium]